MTRVAVTPVLVAAAIAGLAGPRLTSPQDRAANAPFVYAPPPGFTTAPEEALRASPELVNIWVFKDPGAPSTPNITLVHTPKTGRVEAADLADLARGMPDVFKQAGTTWTEVRHETRTRADGSRVGIIEGNTEKGALLGRVFQLIFPDDKGTSIVTASFPRDEIARWAPEIDASVAAATGVATRVPSPSPSTYAAWGFAGGVLAYLGLALGGRGKKKPEPEAKAEADKKDE